MTPVRGVHALLPVLALAATAACSGGSAESKQAQPARRPAVPVAVAAVERKEMPIQIQAIGTVEAFSVVTMPSRIMRGAMPDAELEGHGHGR